MSSHSDTAARKQPTRIPMGGVDKCLLCRWQGRPDEPHGCPRYMDSAASISWLKVPLIGCPGTECGRMLLDGGRSEIVQSFKDEFGPCDEAGRWLAGNLFLCQEHAAKVAAEFGDDIEEIEAEWRATCV